VQTMVEDVELEQVVRAAKAGTDADGVPLLLPEDGRIICTHSKHP